MRLRAPVLIVTLALLAAPLPAAAQQAANKSELVHPSSDYSPGEVIRVQLEALAHNDDPYKDAGIEVVFGFASPANKMVTGPLARFIRMVHNPVYCALLHHQAAYYGELEVQGNQARQSVGVTAANGEHVGYVFILSRQKGNPCDECWMTDSVVGQPVGKMRLVEDVDFPDDEFIAVQGSGGAASETNAAVDLF